MLLVQHLTAGKCDTTLFSSPKDLLMARVILAYPSYLTKGQSIVIISPTYIFGAKKHWHFEISPLMIKLSFLTREE